VSTETVRSADAPSMRSAYAPSMRPAYAEEKRREENTNEESFVTFRDHLALSNARERSTGFNGFRGDLAALARRVDEQPERFGIQGAADA
jgi:hypothetical protein